MKIIAYILFVLQGLSSAGSLSNGALFGIIYGVFTEGYYGLSQMVGYFLPAIIGTILLVLQKRK